MKDLSFLLLKNSLGAKMKKGFKTLCNGDGSTSILNQHQNESPNNSSPPYPYNLENISTQSRKERSPTLEEMILQLDLEEKMLVAARKARLDNNDEYCRRRMSCVNNSDILRSARNALNQYPRFSLDGKDSMYRSSFRNLPPLRGDTGIVGGRKSFCGNSELRKGLNKPKEAGKTRSTLAGESVVWCKPGVVAKLMGLDAIPIPENKSSRRQRSSIVKKKSPKVQKRRVAMDMINDRGGTKRDFVGSCPTSEYVVTRNPLGLRTDYDEAGWPIRHFL